MKKTVIAITVIVAVILSIIYFALSLAFVPTGSTGILIHYGMIQPEPVKSGELVYHNWFSDRVAFVNNKQQDFYVKDQVWGETNDATPVYAQGITVTYQIPVEKSVWVYQNVSDLDKNLVTHSLVASATKAALVELSPKDSTNRAKIEPLVKQKLTELLDNKFGDSVVAIKSVTIDQMDFEAQYNEAIQQNSIAARQAEQQRIANQVAVERAEAEKKVALINTESNIETQKKQKESELELMELEAQAKLKIAEAEAEAKRMLTDTLTPALIEYEKVQKWDGQLPKVMTCNDPNLVINETELK